MTFMLFALSQATEAGVGSSKKKSSNRQANNAISSSQESVFGDKVATKEKSNDPKWKYAVGANLAWSIRKDYGARSHRRFEPEILGYMYYALPKDRLWLRHGARFSYSNDQAQMPKALKIEESDYKVSIEEGIVYDWYFAPSFTLGIGYDWRSIRVKTKSPVVAADNRLNTKESFMWGYGQLGVGVAALRGEYLLEPMLRWQKLAADQRTSWAFGIEFSKAF